LLGDSQSSAAPSALVIEFVSDPGLTAGASSVEMWLHATEGTPGV